MNRSNTGNFCSVDDSYWYDCYCPTCLKSWKIDSYDNRNEYMNCDFKTVKEFERY